MVTQSTKYAFDAVLIGGGIMSVTLATLLKQLEPEWNIQIIERLPDLALESSNPWNNAGTAHSALCELNYTPEQPDGTLASVNAFKTNEQFQVTRQFWSYLVKQGVLKNTSDFIASVPHMSFVYNEHNVNFLRKRYELLKDEPLFHGMEYTEDLTKIAEWAPLIAKGRDLGQPVAATRVASGTDVNFGRLTRLMAEGLRAKGVEFVFDRLVTGVKRYDEGWAVSSKGGGKKFHTTAKFVFVGAGGGALTLLQKSKIAEIKGYAGFPVSGKFFRTKNQDLVAHLQAKVYGKAAVGAPPMSVPHLDTRVVDGEKALMFGPYGGFTPKFLKTGSWFDLFGSIRFNNLWPMIVTGATNLSLVGYLIGELLSTNKKRLKALRAYFPEAELKDWELITAGQRVQVIKRGPNGGGILSFGTEVIAAKDGSIAGLLGASPGASIAPSAMFEVLQRSFPDKMDGWLPKIKEIIPSYGIKLSEQPELAAKILQDTAITLNIPN